MMISSGTAFLIVLFYLFCLLAARVSVRRFYKRMWTVAATLLGVSICFAATIYLVSYFAVLIAI